MMLRQYRKISTAALKALAKSKPVSIVSRVRPFSVSLLQTRFLSTVPADKVQSLINDVSRRQQESAATVVPWFLNNMPSSYFRQIPEELRDQHLKAIQAIRDLKQSDLSLKIETKGSNGASQVTFITSSNKRGQLSGQASQVSAKKGDFLSRVKVFTSLDGELSLNVFFFENEKKPFETSTATDAASIFAFAEEVKAGKHTGDAAIERIAPSLFEKESISEYLNHITPLHTRTSDPRRFFIQRSLFEKVRGTEGTAVFIEDYNGHEKINVGSSWSWITLAATNVLPEVLTRCTADLLARNGLDVARANCDLLRDPGNATPGVAVTGTVAMMRILVTPNVSSHSTPIISQSDFQRALQTELERVKWIDDETTNLVSRHPFLGIDKAEVLTALCSLLHGPLSKLNGTTYSSIPTILAVLNNQHVIHRAEEIAGLFLDKFRPVGTTGAGVVSGLSEADFAARANEIESKIVILQNETSRTLLLKLLDAVKKTLRTNFFNSGRYALSLRVDPTIMVPADTPVHKIPYGVFFCHGRNFNAFHCRFRDIARGGLRIVTPLTGDMHVLASANQFDEAYGLSYAQQLKNKDIPEGGSKAVVLVNSSSISPFHKEFAMRKAVKAFTDSLLDLIVKPSVSKLVDYYKKDELIYLGPDEQVIPWDIDWITQRAVERQYPIPSAFMSSKAGAGFNHKTYGVTSEGVVVYLDAAMRNVLSIDPYKQPFTVKITGGPDGDVAGNLIKILFREYGKNCKVVGIADGFGVAEDPNGLDAGELLRLFEAGSPITGFNKDKLSYTGIMMDRSTEEGLARANSMFLRVKADVFVPGGGRPNTMNGSNWRQFLDVNGKPSSPLIVEGANIFNTPEARANLFKHAGVVFVKDSSANKCGVITSSFEVQASMLLSKDEFLAVKDELVKDVVVRLKEYARLEADLLFRAYKNFPGDLPHFSERISDAINRCTDAIADRLATVNPEDPLFQELLPLIKENLPHKLVEVAWDRVPSRFPVQYQRCYIASTLASQLVYHEGIHLVESQATGDIADRAIQYYRASKSVGKLCDDIESKEWSGVDAESKKRAVDLLRRGGVRTSLVNRQDCPQLESSGLGTSTTVQDRGIDSKYSGKSIQLTALAGYKELKRIGIPSENIYPHKKSDRILHRDTIGRMTVIPPSLQLCTNLPPKVNLIEHDASKIAKIVPIQSSFASPSDATKKTEGHELVTVDQRCLVDVKSGHDTITKKIFEGYNNMNEEVEKINYLANKLKYDLLAKLMEVLGLIQRAVEVDPLNSRNTTTDPAPQRNLFNLINNS